MAEALSVRCLSHTTEADFAFLIDSECRNSQPTPFKGVALPLSYINLLRCAASVAAYSFGIHDTTHHVPLASRATQTSFAIGVIGIRSLLRSRPIHQPLTLHASPWERPFGPTHYPFSYQLTDWFHCEVGTTRYSLRTLVPLRASRCALFPQHQLYCYTHRSYQ